MQLRKGSIELAILATLWPGPLYGLELLRELQYCTGLIVSEGTLYPLLARLETAGLVDPQWVDAGLGHPRKYYTLTEDGRNRTLAMAKRWWAFTGNIDHLLENHQLKPVRKS